jgi:heptosyltransferase-1
MRILIVRVGAMGDVLHALPAVAALRRERPEWEIDWVVDPRWASLLVDDAGRGAVVDRVHLAETKLWSKAPLSLKTLRSVWGLRSALRARRYDLVVDLQGTLRSGVIGWFAGAKVFAGYSDPRESMAAWFYSRRVVRLAVPQGLKPLSLLVGDGRAEAPPLQSNGVAVASSSLQSISVAMASSAIPNSHVVEQGAALLAVACGVALELAAVALPRVGWAEVWAEREAALTRPLCVLGAGGGWAAKHWPVERYGALAVALRGLGFDVVVNAARADDAVALGVVTASQGAARIVVCHVAGLVALLRRTDLFVGGDTGPTHLAAGLAVPLVALFGPTDPLRNGPWGPGAKVVLRDAASRTSYRHVDTVDAGLGRMSVEAVLEAVRSLPSEGNDERRGR